MLKKQKLKVGFQIPPLNVTYYNLQSKKWITGEVAMIIEKIIEHRDHLELKCLVGTEFIHGRKTIWVKHGKFTEPMSKKVKFTMPVEADVKKIHHD